MVEAMLTKRLKELRKQSELTQAELSEKLKIGRVSVSNYENGDRTPDAELIIRFADFFGVTTDYLLGRSLLVSTKESILYEAVKHFGVETQMRKAIEECGELIVAIAKNDTPNIAEEVADVRIMLDQIEIILGIDTGMIRQSKLERLSLRIKEEDNKS